MYIQELFNSQSSYTSVHYRLYLKRADVVLIRVAKFTLTEIVEL